MSPMVISLIVLAMAMVSFMLDRVPMAMTALSATAVLVALGALKPATALSYFGNANVVTIIMMFIVSAGFNRTQFAKNAARKSVELAKGSFTKIMFAYVFIAIVLAQFIPSPLVVFTIMSPLMAATCVAIGVSSSKTMFALGIACIVPTIAFPLGAGTTTFLELNGYLEASEYVTYSVKMWDPALGRFPTVLACLLYCSLIAPKLSPDTPPVPIELGVAKGSKDQTALPPLQEKMGYIIFFGTTLALMLEKVVGLPIWLISMIGALLMILTGVLKERDAYSSVPWNIVFMLIGALCISASLSETGAGNAIGDVIAGFVGGLNNQYLIAAVFYIVPLIMTQFMNNRGVMLIFTPIAVLACKSLGANPVGIMLLVQSACLTALMTPMATVSVPVMMAAGGYDQKSVLKQSWLPILIFSAVSILWIPTIFPLY